jgi:hypothetical protein
MPTIDSTGNLRAAQCPATGSASHRPSTTVRCRPSIPRANSVPRTCHFTRVRAQPVPNHWQCFSSAIHRSEMPPSIPRTISVLRTCHFTRVRAQPVPNHWQCFSSAIHHCEMPTIESTGNLRTPTVTGGACHRPSTTVRCRPSIPRTISVLHSAQSLAVLVDGRPPL